MGRNRCTVTKVSCTPFITTEERPYRFLHDATVLVWVTRTYRDGSREEALLSVHIGPGAVMDGASTFWPISRLVPHWVHGDDHYNAGPAVHDILYILEGALGADCEDLSREECDDILRGIWRCWGMSRFLAGCADKAIELVAGGKNHWGNDSYNARPHVSVNWETIKTE